MNFLKTVLAVIVGFFITLSIALFALIGIASTFAPKEETFVVEDNAILELNFTEPVYEYGAPMRVKDFDYSTMRSLRRIPYRQYSELSSMLRKIPISKELYWDPLKGWKGKHT